MTETLSASEDEVGKTYAHERACRESCESINFRALLQAKRRIIGSLLAVTLGFFIGMTLLAGYAKEFMTTKLVGSFNVGYGLILAAYAICWVGALLYVRAANITFDEKTALVIKEHRARGKQI